MCHPDDISILHVTEDVTSALELRHNDDGSVQITAETKSGGGMSGNVVGDALLEDALYTGIENKIITPELAQEVFSRKPQP